MKRMSRIKQLTLISLVSVMVFFTACSKDQVAGPKNNASVAANQLKAVSVDPGDASTVYDGWLRAYLIRSGGQTYFCNSLTDRSRAFMWGQAYMITGVEDFYDRTQRGDVKQLITDLLNTFMTNEITSNSNKNLAWDSWNDDLEWAIIALIRGYQITGNTAYRDAAVTNWNVVYNRGWDATYGGGIWENMDNVPNGGKGCLSNYPAIICGAMIYNSTGNTDILNKCKSIYSWSRSHLFNTSTGKFSEDWGPNGQNTNPDDNVYNNGIAINAANALYQITKTAQYLSDAQLAASHQINIFPILTQDKPANGDFGGDQFVRGLALLARQNNLWGTYGQYLTNQCAAAWNKRRTDYNISWNNWGASTTTGDLRAMEAEGSVVVQAVTPVGLSVSINSGTYKIINRASGKALDAKGLGTANGTQLIQWAYNGGNNQRWTLTYLGNGEYKLINVASGRSIDATGASTNDNVKLLLWDFSGATNQKFYLASPENGYYSFIFEHSGKAVDVAHASTADGDSIIQYTYHGGYNQQWQIVAP